MQKAQRKTLLLIALLLGNFVIGSTFAIQAPFFPKEAELKGATPSQYGFVFGIFQLTFFLLSPVYGKTVALLTPNFMLLAGAFLVGGSVFLFGFLDYSPEGTPFLALAYVLRIVEGIGSAAYNIASFTILAMEFPDNVAKTMATVETAFGVGVIIAPTLGGALYQAGGFVLPFTSLGALVVLFVGIIYFVLPKSDFVEQVDSGDALKFWFHPSVILDATIVFVASVCIGYNAATLEPHLRQFGLSPIILGVVFISSGLFYAITVPLWGWLCDNLVNTKALCIFGCSFLFVGFLFVGPIPLLHIPTKLWLVIVSLATYGVGLGCCFVAPFVGTLRHSVKVRGFPDDLTTYGLVSSMVASAQSFGTFVGPSVGGLLLEKIGYKAGTLVIVAIIALLIVILSLYVCQERICRGQKSNVKLKEQNTITYGSIKNLYTKTEA